MEVRQASAVLPSTGSGTAERTDSGTARRTGSGTADEEGDEEGTGTANERGCKKKIKVLAYIRFFVEICNLGKHNKISYDT